MEGLCGLAEGEFEGAVSGAVEVADGACGGVDEGQRASAAGFGPGLIGEAEALGTEGWFACLELSLFAFVADEVEEFLEVLVASGFGEAGPGWEEGEPDLLVLGEVHGLDALAASLGLAERGFVDPGALEGLVVEEGAEGGGTWPLEGAGHETFLDALAQEVEESGQLGLGFVADEGAGVTAAPEGVASAQEPVELAGELAVDKAHEGGELGGILDPEQEVEVVGKEADAE